MNLNSETRKIITKVAIALLLIICGIIIGARMGFTPCKVAISLNPGIELCQPETKPVVFSVKSDTGWQDTGLSVQTGQTLNIIASGSVNTWGGEPIGYSPSPNGQTQNDTCPSTINVPNCLINGEFYGTLIGKIGKSGMPFRIGAENIIPVTANGNLFLAINDNEPYMQDNSGEYSVSISIK